MQNAQAGIYAIFLAVVGIGGGSYAISGDRDFTVEVGRPLPEVYEEFSGIKTFGSGLRDEGFDVPEIVITRPSDHELVFTAPSVNPEQSSRIAFTFEPGANSAMTRVTAAIDVPPVQTVIDGENKHLSEEKVENHFREAIADLAKQMNQGNSTTKAAHRMALLLDTVALASHPEQYHKVQARVKRLQAAEDRINARLREEHQAKIARMRNNPAEYARFGEPTDGRQRSYEERYGTNY